MNGDKAMAMSCKIHAAEDLGFEAPDDAMLAPHEAEVQLGAAGICGSDIH
jgi:L-idonate 5-dehydrogenase